MPHDLMKECQEKRLFIREGKKLLDWVVVQVSSLESGVTKGTRCMHCHGAVRIHKQKVSHGPDDHVEHRSRQDSERCKGGIYFKGTHQLSLMPVE